MDEEMGPIDIVVIGFPPGAPMTGEAVPLLMDLVDKGTVRVLDVMFVTKDEDGTVAGFDATDLTSKDVGDFRAFEGASSGLLGNDDMVTAAEALDPGSAAVLLSTRTAGPRRSPTRCAATEASCWPPSASPSRTWPPHSTPLSKRPERRDQPMPGLLRAAARTAVIAGTATSVSQSRQPPPGRALGRSRRPRPQQPAAPQGGGARPRPDRTAEGARASFTPRACSPTRSSPSRRRRLLG